MVETTDVVVPDLGDLTGADVTQVIASVGARVAAGDVLLQLESEKAVLEVISPCVGRVAEMLVQRGDRVSTGQPVVKLVPAGNGEPDQKRLHPTDQGETPAAAVESTTVRMPAKDLPPVPALPSQRPKGRIYAGPTVRRLARELGVHLGGVHGTGPRSRILPSDVKHHVRHRSSAVTEPSPSTFPGTENVEKYGSVSYEPLTRIQHVSARRLLSSWLSIPHVTQHNDADITQLEAVRRALRMPAAATIQRLTLLPFLFRAVAITLREMPRFNSSLCADGAQLAIKQYVNVGFAADTPRGLLVPVVRDVDQKDIFEIASELATLAADARAGRLSPSEMQGATFTVSSLGSAGGTHFTPIVNPPEVAILGAGRARLAAVPVDQGVVTRMMLPISLSYDHRVIDGVAGARFTERIVALLASPESLMTAVP